MEMKRCQVVLLTAILMVSSMMIVHTSSGEFDLGSPTRVTEPTNNLTVLHINLTYPNGSAGKFIWIDISNSNSRYGGYVSNVTDEHGLTTIVLSAWMWGICRIIAIDHLGNYSLYQLRFIGPDEDLDLHLQLQELLPDVNTLTGTVTNLTSGSPVPGVKLTFSGADLNRNEFYRMNTTDALGKYSITFPDSNSNLYLSGPDWNDPEFYTSHFDFFTETGVTDYVHDVVLLPKKEATYPVSIRFLNTTTGSEILWGNVYVDGYDGFQNNIRRYSMPFPSSISPGGFTNGYLPTGEYRVRWSFSDPLQGATFETTTFFLVNQSAVEFDVHIDYPQLFRPVTVSLTDGGHPLENAYVNVRMEIPDGENIAESNCNLYTDIDGESTFGLPAGILASISISKDGYNGRFVNIPQSMDLSPLDLDFELVPKPMGNLSLLIKDNVTNVILPGSACSIYGQNWKYIGEFPNGNDGYLNLTLEAQVITSISIYSSLGSKYLENVEILPGQVTELTVFIERNVMPGDQYSGQFTLKDPSGAPIPYQQISISTTDPGKRSSASVMSDEDGIARFKLEQGNYSLNIYSNQLTKGYWRNIWTPISSYFSFPIGGGTVPDVTAYRCYPLTTVEGFVRDALTGEPLPSVTISASSRIYYAEGESLYLGSFDMGSSHEGYYRIWGRDNVSISFSKEGYFSKYLQFDVNLTPRSGFDVLLTPIHKRDLWLNGTLVDESDAPMRGHISVSDSDTWKTIEEQEAGDDGKFYIPLYAGNFSVSYYDIDYELSEQIYLSLESPGIDDLVLKLVPKETLTGSVRSWNGTPVIWASLSFECISGYKEGMIFTSYTGEDGTYWLYGLYSGTYRVTIDGGYLYDEFMSDPFDFDGRSQITMDFVMGNRTYSNIYGHLYGSGGPLTDGVPFVTIRIKDDADAILKEVISNIDGEFHIEKVPFGTGYSLEMVPPDNLSYVKGIRSGYNTTVMTGINLTDPDMYLYPYLDYIVVEGDEPLIVWDSDPWGSKVPTVEPLLVRFSLPVETSTFLSAFSIEPDVQDMTFEWDRDDSRVTIHHADFEFNTTYTVTIGTGLKATNGNSLFEPFEWSFTTVSLDLGWFLYGSSVEVGDDMTVNASATGLPNMTLFIVIDGAGSFELPETSAGAYYVSISSEEFEWNTTYTYHFSNASDGEDIQTEFGGTFTTPLEPGTGDDDDDDDDDTAGLGAVGTALICAGALILVILVLLIIVAVILLLKRKRGPEEEE